MFTKFRSMSLIASGLFNDIHIIKTKNEEKIQEAIDLYWKACEMPRKKKKKVRKLAQFDYNFWNAISNHYNKITEGY